MSRTEIKRIDRDDINTDHNLMIMTIENKEIYIPQDDILSFESVQDLDLVEVAGHSVGWITNHKGRIPVYCFSEALELLDRSSKNIKICVLLNQVNIALLCDDIRIMNASNVNIVDMPECMASTNTPVKSFCIFTDNRSIDKFGLLFRSSSIKKYIDKYPN